MLWKILVYGFLAWLSADILGCLLNGGKIVARTGKGNVLRLKHFTRRHTVWNFFRAVGIGVLVGLAHYWPRAAKSPTLGCIFFALMMLLLAVSLIWCLSHLRRWSELFWFAVLSVALILAAESATHVMASWWTSRTLSWIFFVGPWMVFALVVGFVAFVLAMRFFWRVKAVIWKIIAIILAIATVASVVAIAINGDKIAGLPKKVTAKTSVKSGTDTQKPAKVDSDVVEEFWCTFYNDECQKNDDEEDDFNFGLNPYEKGMSAAELAKIHRSVMLNDPANGTAAMCWVDQHIGTRYMGDQFYSEYEGKDDAAINKAIGIYVDNEKLYKNTMTVFWTCMDRATVEVRDVEKGSLHDQMYMNPGNQSLRGIPDVAVYFPRGDEGGHYLVYTFTIKGATVEVPFRVECLFQPTNVTEYLDVEVKEKPSTGGGSNPGGNNPGGDNPGDDNPKPSPTESPSNPYNKDKSLSDNSGVNDDPGPGENTNNGVGARYSSKDNGSNSDHMTKSEYDQRQKELEAINGSQKTGKDDSTPSYNGGGTVDNNGAAANTPSSQVPKEPEVAGDSSNQQWDGSGI